MEWWQHCWIANNGSAIGSTCTSPPHAKQVAYDATGNITKKSDICNSGGTPTWRYVGVDHLGSVSSLVDSTMTVVERDSYDSWGKRRNETNGTDDPTCSITSQASRGFTAHEMLSSFCLINMNARLYDPSLGRFMGADDRVPGLYATQAHNRFSYVNNNPLNQTDPTGHGGGADDDSLSAMTKEWLVCASANCSNTYAVFPGDWPWVPDGDREGSSVGYQGNNNWNLIPPGNEYMGGANPGIPAGGTHGGGGIDMPGNEDGGIETVVVTGRRDPVQSTPFCEIANQFNNNTRQQQQGAGTRYMATGASFVVGLGLNASRTFFADNITGDVGYYDSAGFGVGLNLGYFGTETGFAQNLTAYQLTQTYQATAGVFITGTVLYKDSVWNRVGGGYGRGMGIDVALSVGTSEPVNFVVCN